jgi:signal transduction histidine kinase/ActR/RegA family two-component response regulator
MKPHQTDHNAAKTQGLARLHLKPLSLRFSGPQEHLEPAFQSAYLANSIIYMRLALVLAAILYGIFGILDALLIPHQKEVTWLIRFAVVCPAMLLVAAASRYPRVQQRMQELLAAIVVIAGVGIIVMIIIAPPPVNYSYYAGLIIVFIFGYTFARMRFVWASLAAWIVVVFYEIAAIGVTQTPLPVLINNNFFFISANLIGMLACYSIERNARRNFFLMRLLAEEQDKVRAANQELEQRVQARTAELEKTNLDLALEIRERQRTEAERMHLAEQLKQSEKMEAIGSMAAGVAHDLNNILSGLVSYPELLLMDLPEDSPLRETIETIKASGDKAAAMVQDLLTLARRGVENRRVVAPNRLIREYLASHEFAALVQHHAHVHFSSDLDDELLNVMASPVHLTKALMNLITNAFEAHMVAGKVRLATRNRSLDLPLAGYETIPAGDYAVLSVSDSGVGIAPEDLERIFEPFFTKKRLDRSGTGLGMSVVWSTVKDVGGYIDVQSREGRGTTFTLYLPVTREAAAAPGERATYDDMRGNEKVLVVDDLGEQREIAAAMLGKLGYRVSSVSSGEAALDFLEKDTADILVLDMIMDPGMDGCETYRRILQRNADQKAVIASGYAESDRVREAQRLGAGPYVRKPYTLEKIALAVRQELDRGIAGPP